MSVFRQIFFCIVEIETVVRTPTMHRKFSSFRNFPKNATFQSEKNGKIEKNAIFQGFAKNFKEKIFTFSML